MRRGVAEALRVRQQLSSLAVEMGDDLRPMVGETVEALSGNLPADEPGVVLPSLVEAVLRYYFDSAASAFSLDAGSEGGGIEIGARCAIEGLSYEGASLLVHIAASEARDRLFVKWAGAHGVTDLERVNDVAHALSSLEVELRCAVHEGFVDTQRAARSVGSSLLDALLRRLLEHPIDAPGETLQRIARMGVELTPPIVVVLLRPYASDDGDAAVPRALLAEPDEGVLHLVAQSPTPATGRSPTTPRP